MDWTSRGERNHEYIGSRLRLEDVSSYRDPNIKRTICKKCHIILYPGITSIVRLKSKRAKHCVITCLLCGAVKRFLNKSNYELWYDKPESQISVEYLGKHISK